MSHFLGIDVGTSGTKAIVLDDAGSVLGTGSGLHEPDAPKPGWSEQDPEGARQLADDRAGAMRQLADDVAMMADLGLQTYRFIESKKSALVLVSFILPSRNSTAASSSMGCSSLRSTHIF